MREMQASRVRIRKPGSKVFGDITSCHYISRTGNSLFFSWCRLRQLTALVPRSREDPITPRMTHHLAAAMISLSTSTSSLITGDDLQHECRPHVAQYLAAHFRVGRNILRIGQ